MFSFSRIGQNMAPCNRQYSTMGVAKSRPEDMALKPEYLGNEHFKFLNNFGLTQPIISNKRFVDINNSLNRCHVDSGVVPNSCIMPSLAGNKLPNHRAWQGVGYGSVNKASKPTFIEVTKPSSIITEETTKTNMAKHEKSPPCDSSLRQEEPRTCSSDKPTKKTKRNKAHSHCDNKQSQNSKKPKKQKNFQKKSKRESDRSVCVSSPQKRKNKPWHKQSLKMELMEIDESYSEPSIESPVVVAEHSAICIQTKLCSPQKLGRETQTESPKPSLNTSQICNSPKQGSFRPRLPSECDSEDSFIVFEDGAKWCDMEVSDCGQDSTDFDLSSDDCSSSEEDSDEDKVDFYSVTKKFTDCIAAAASSSCKKVRFANDKDLCEVHPMVQWSFAYQKARKGPWEQYALDRMRFRNRVSNAEPTLSTVLQPAHRSRIFQERFLHDES